MGFVRDLKGKRSARAATEAGEIQAGAAEEASGLFNPLGFGGGAQSQLADLDSQIEALRAQQVEQQSQPQSSGGGRVGAFHRQAGLAAGQALDSQLQDLIGQRDALAGQPAQQPGLGQQGLNQSQFLTDPQAQFDFLQNNPLFQASLENANTATNKLAAARGRLSSGDTLQQLSQNTLLAASPLIQQQKGSILDLLGFGERATANQANLRTGAGAARAGGVVGAANARSQGATNLLNLGGQIAGAFAGVPPGLLSGGLK